MNRMQISWTKNLVVTINVYNVVMIILLVAMTTAVHQSDVGVNGKHFDSHVYHY